VKEKKFKPGFRLIKRRFIMNYLLVQNGYKGILVPFKAEDSDFLCKLLTSIPVSVISSYADSALQFEKDTIPLKFSIVSEKEAEKLLG
jgi:hypothetical protein